jgi:peptide/nickel transport system ATP-binding protein
MLEIRQLSVRIGAHEIVAIDDVHMPAGGRLGLVGESGAGKTMTAMTIVGLQPSEASVSGSIRLDGRELVGLGEKQLSRIRGSQIGVVFQDPLQALNPLMRVGRQVSEVIRLHERVKRSSIRSRVHELLRRVGLPDATQIASRYPHQLSGGQRQRVLIAMAIACQPRLLIADEPTTSLDVTVQQGILELLVDLSARHGMGLLFVSHDLGVVRAVSESVAVMYGGQLMEKGPVDNVISTPHHRYTEALVSANPGHAGSAEIGSLLGQPLTTIRGSVPAVGSFPSGCRFRDRCDHAVAECSDRPGTTEAAEGHFFNCWNPANAAEVQTDASVG